MGRRTCGPGIRKPQPAIYRGSDTRRRAMQRELIKHVLRRTDYGATVTVAGWVRTRRDSKGGFSFIELNDGSAFDSIQIVADGDLPNYDRDIPRLHTGAAIAVTGELVESPGSGQRVEVKAAEIEVFGFADPESYPLQKKRISFEKLREIAHLRARTNTFGAVTRVRNALAYATHRFYQERDFLYLHAPMITASDAETIMLRALLSVGEVCKVANVLNSSLSSVDRSCSVNSLYSASVWLRAW